MDTKPGRGDSSWSTLIKAPGFVEVLIFGSTSCVLQGFLSVLPYRQLGHFRIGTLASHLGKIPLLAN